MGPRGLLQDSVELELEDSVEYPKTMQDLTQYEIDQTTREGTVLDQSQITETQRAIKVFKGIERKNIMEEN